MPVLAMGLPGRCHWTALYCRGSHLREALHKAWRVVWTCNGTGIDGTDRYSEPASKSVRQASSWHRCGQIFELRWITYVLRPRYGSFLREFCEIATVRAVRVFDAVQMTSCEGHFTFSSGAWLEQCTRTARRAQNHAYLRVSCGRSLGLGPGCKHKPCIGSCIEPISTRRSLLGRCLQTLGLTPPCGTTPPTGPGLPEPPSSAHR